MTMARDTSVSAAMARAFFAAVESPTLGPGCYDAAFELGRKAWLSSGPDVLAWAAPSCETGFVHGALVAGYTSAGRDLLGTACTDAAVLSDAPDKWTESMMLTCAVGAGRALAQSGESLPGAVSACEAEMSRLKSPFDVSAKAPSFCVRGVVLDYFSGSTDVNSVVNQCQELTPSYAEACVTLGTRIPASRSAQTTMDLSQRCLALEGGVRQACFYALSDALANRLFFEGSDVPAEARKSCVAENDCLWHYAKYIMTATWDRGETRRACALLSSPAPRECIESIPYLAEDLKADGHIG